METMNINAPTPQKRGGKKWILWAGIGAGALALVVAAIFLIPMLFASKMELADYIKVNYVDGYHGSGTVILEFEYDKLAKDLEFEERKDIRELKKIQDQEGYSLDVLMDNIEDFEDNYDLDLDELEDLFEAITIKIKDNGTFGNGDTAIIEIKVDEDEDMGRRLQGGTIEYEIKGLPTLTAIDLTFDCTFVGRNGYGSYSAQLTNFDEATLDYVDWTNYIEFSSDIEDGTLSNGDVITVTLSINEYNYDYLCQHLLEGYYTLPREQSITFTVEGLTELLTAKDMTAERIAQIKAIAQEEITIASPITPVFSMIFFADCSDSSGLIVALEFPDAEAGKTWNHIRYFRNVSLDENGQLQYEEIEHVLGGNGFDAKAQEAYIRSEFSGATLTKLA